MATRIADDHSHIAQRLRQIQIEEGRLKPETVELSIITFNDIIWAPAQYQTKKKYYDQPMLGFTQCVACRSTIPPEKGSRFSCSGECADVVDGHGLRDKIIAHLHTVRVNQ